MGGTELHFERLLAAFPEEMAQVQYISSRPQEYTLEDKPRILHLHDTAQDPASACLRDKSYRTNFNKIVCVSHRQAYDYSVFLGIAPSELTVVKNSVPLLQPTLPKPIVDGRIRFIYTSTPHRGLEILAVVARELAKVRQDWVLDVYSSFKLYGRDTQDLQYAHVYEMLKTNPCVNYHGTQPNEVVRQACLDAHVMAYPSVYYETSCMAIMEAMMSGCLVITSSLGALPETCGDWAWMFPYSENPDHVAQHTYNMMISALDHYSDPAVQVALQLQSGYYQNFYSFEARKPQWKALLDVVIKEGRPQEKLVIY
jgi:glycosyltransferase involved in cell wall biosynthesis